MKKDIKNNTTPFEEGSVKLERCFGPEQMMVPTKRSKSSFRDINVRMKNYTLGPLGQLQKWRLEKIRVKFGPGALIRFEDFAPASSRHSTSTGTLLLPMLMNIFIGDGCARLGVMLESGVHQNTYPVTCL